MWMIQKRFHFILLILAGLGLFITGCKITETVGGPVQTERLADGIYEGVAEGGPNKAAVRVTIEDRRIARVEILSHDAWKGKKAEPVIPDRIVEEQSTVVEAVTGATNSSHVIMNAVHAAVEKSYASNSSAKE
jgi:uncharacterized protein with FMN-binding domain